MPDGRGRAARPSGTGSTDGRLDSFFTYDQLVKDPAKTAREVWVNGPYDYYNADKYNPQNEPDLVAPYTYLSTGQPRKTTDVVHAALTLFTDTPTGMTGNDDLGTMSAWNVLSSIGIFPVQPGYDTWGLSRPVFDRVDLARDRRYYPRGSLTVRAPGTSDARRYMTHAATCSPPASTAPPTHGRTWRRTTCGTPARSRSPSAPSPPRGARPPRRGRPR